MVVMGLWIGVTGRPTHGDLREWREGAYVLVGLARRETTGSAATACGKVITCAPPVVFSGHPPLLPPPLM